MISTSLKSYFSKLIKSLLKVSRYKFMPILTLNGALILFQTLYISLRIDYVIKTIPFWYTRLWGESQLTDKHSLWYIPLISFLVLFTGLIFAFLLDRIMVQYGRFVILALTIFVNGFLTMSLIRIILVSAVPFSPLILPLYVDLLIPFAISFLLVHTLTPVFINIFTKFGIITNPRIHAHPGMALKEASARGGGFIFALVFILMSLIFVGLVNRQIIGLLLAVFLLALLGLLDDYQNTHTNTQARILENPLLRLLLMFSIVSIIIVSGVSFNTLATLPGFLGSVTFLPLLSGIFTAIWIVWVMNVLSWSNGIDGQYNGVVGIALLVMTFLAVRFFPLEEIYIKYATLAVIAAGAAFGFTKYVWHPSKIMWGFGAVCAGVVLSTLSILISAKITVSVLIILVPFLDAFISVVRRIMQKKNPLKGDRQHFHHILMLRGWSVRRIAVFYWFTTLLFGSLALISSERLVLQLGLILIGFVGSAIVVLNVITWRLQEQKQKSV